jgi:hypothetical protein
MTSKIEMRKRAGWSQDRAALRAGTSREAVRLFETLPDEAARAVIPIVKYEALVAVWAEFQAKRAA